MWDSFNGRGHSRAFLEGFYSRYGFVLNNERLYDAYWEILRESLVEIRGHRERHARRYRRPVPCRDTITHAEY
jgi:hypothetical protein